MTVTILGIIATLLGAIWFLWKRAILKTDEPDEIAKRKKEELARNIIKGDSAAESVRVNDLLRSIKGLQGGSERPSRDHSEGRPDDPRPS